MKKILLLLVFAVLPLAAQAQSLNLDLGAAGSAGATSRLVQLTALITVLSLAPSLLVMVTAFTRIVIVLSLLRSALGTQGAPPTTVLIGLALFLTFFVMQPVLDAGLDFRPAADVRRTGRRTWRACASPPSRSGNSCWPICGPTTFGCSSTSPQCPTPRPLKTRRGAP